jgi:GNAT superfamily N-acetyltransferase
LTAPRPKTPDALSFAPAGLADADALAELRVVAMRESLERIGRFDPQRARDRLLANFSPSCTEVIVWEGRRVGFHVVRRAPEGLVLDHLYLLPSHQGRGIGAAVLSRVLSTAHREGLAVRVTALKGSEANAFYVRHGFALIAESEFDNEYLRLPSAASAPPSHGD